MSVLLKTTLGNIVIDLYVQGAPISSFNFIKLCKIKYYCKLQFECAKVIKDFVVEVKSQDGTLVDEKNVFGLMHDFKVPPPSAPISKPVIGKTNPATRAPSDILFDQTLVDFWLSSSYGKPFGSMYPPKAEYHPRLRHNKIGIVSLDQPSSSSFFITLSDRKLDYLDGKHSVFGVVAEGLDTLEYINDALVDDSHVPFRIIRILDSVVLYDPFADCTGFPTIDEWSQHFCDTIRKKGVLASQPNSRIRFEHGEHEGGNDDEDSRRLRPGCSETKDLDPSQHIRESDAQFRAQVLELIGDVPSSTLHPPETVLFVCKLNPVTSSSDLDLIFSRFGACKSTVVYDRATSQSLCYAFVEFESKSACEKAYFRMDGAVIDDRRIKADFSQSVSKLWSQHVLSRSGDGKGGTEAGKGAGAGVKARVGKSRLPLDVNVKYNDRTSRGGSVLDGASIKNANKSFSSSSSSSYSRSFDSDSLSSSRRSYSSSSSSSDLSLSFDVPAKKKRKLQSGERERERGHDRKRKRMRKKQGRAYGGGESSSRDISRHSRDRKALRARGSQEDGKSGGRSSRDKEGGRAHDHKHKHKHKHQHQHRHDRKH